MVLRDHNYLTEMRLWDQLSSFKAKKYKIITENKICGQKCPYANGSKSDASKITSFRGNGISKPVKMPKC